MLLFSASCLSTQALKRPGAKIQEGSHEHWGPNNSSIPPPCNKWARPSKQRGRRLSQNRLLPLLQDTLLLSCLHGLGLGKRVSLPAARALPLSSFSLPVCGGKHPTSFPLPTDGGGGGQIPQTHTDLKPSCNPLLRASAATASCTCI